MNDTNPPTDDYESVPDPREALKKYEQAQAAKKKAQERARARDLAKAEKAEKAEQQAFFSRRPRGERHESSHQPTPYKHVPKNAASSHESTAIPRRPSQTYRPVGADTEPLEPYHTRASADAFANEEENEDTLFQIRAALESRPKTSAAACIDYSGPSNETSASTSRSQTTDYSVHKRRVSTGVTSIATPGETKRTSYQPERVSEQILQDGAQASLADATAKALMMQELARRRAEYKAGPARPASRASAKPASINSERPRSQAGSIAGSVLDGVRDYVRPRASMDSMRSTRSDTGLSRTQSRSSSTSRRDSNGGWRSQLRRRGSFSSWRNRPQAQEPRSPDPGVVNLNRDLPALPGLDQYKEKKPKPAHIAQIMRAPKQKKPKDISTQQYAPPSVAAPLSPEEEQRRQYEIRRAVEERMRMTTMLASRESGQRPMTMGAGPVQSHPELTRPNFPEGPRTQSSPAVRTVNGPTPHVTVLETPKKKPSLRKRLSRFWSAGGKSVSGAPGKMVAAN